MASPTLDEIRAHWALDPDVTHLNHGSFGACPRAVLEAQTKLRGEMERQPVRFLSREIEGMLDRALEKVARFVGARPEDTAFVANATAGVNAVLRSLRFEAGDELLTTTHEYNACANALRFVAERWGARVVVADVPFPLRSPDEVVGAIMERVTARTRIALVSHVTSPTALVFPIERIVRELRGAGVETLVDGAHAPGMIPVDLESLGAAWYTANCHKWMCAPKGAAFLWAREDAQAGLRPASISHGYNAVRTDRSRFRLEFGWTGTDDQTAQLCAPDAVEYVGGMLPGGWDEVMRRNRALALEGRDILCAAMGVDAPAPDEMIGSMASVPLPDGAPEAPTDAKYRDPLQKELYDWSLIEVPIPAWPAPPKRLLRISAQLYNEAAEYERLAGALVDLLRGGG